jgi:hypothetical protein
VCTDAKRFHERQLVEGKYLRRMQLARGQNEAVAQTAFGVDAEYLQALAAVALAAFAGNAMFAVQVRLHGAAVANRNVRYALTDGEYFDAELVTNQTRIRKKRLSSGKGVNIRAANPDAMNAHKGFSGAGCSSFRQSRNS